MTASLHHHHPRVLGETFLVTRQAAIFLGVNTTLRYLRKVCQPVACDVASRAALYDLDALTERFAARPCEMLDESRVHP